MLPIIAGPEPSLPGLRAAPNVVPPVVPSVTQSSRPCEPSLALKKTFDPTRRKDAGFELAAAPMNELLIGIILGRASANDAQNTTRSSRARRCLGIGKGRGDPLNTTAFHD